MAFTKIVGAGIHTLSNVNTHNINSSGIITATQFVGIFTGTDGDFSGNVTIDGNLVVNGDTTTLNTTLREVEILRVSAASTLPAGIITQTGTGDILNLHDGGTAILSVKDGGNIIMGAGAGSVDPHAPLHIRTGTTGAITTLLKLHGPFTSNTGSEGTSIDFGTASDTSTGARIIGTREAAGAKGALRFCTGRENDSGFNNGRIVIDETGKVGIGTDNPTQKVQINNGVDDPNIVLLYGADTSTEYAGIGVFEGNATFTGGGIGSNNTGISLRTANGGTEIERLRITGIGSVGIGTDDPSQKLHLYGSVSTLIRVQNSDDGIAGITFANTGSSNWAIKNENAHLRFELASNEKVRFNSDGNVGINSTTPANKLDVRLGAAWIYPDEDGTEAIALKLGKLKGYNTSFNDILVADNDGSSSPTYRVTNKINRYIATWHFDRTTSPGVTRLNAFQLRSYDSSSAIGNAFIIRDLKDTADSIKLWTNGDSFIGVTTDGTSRNLGIGTDSPQKPLNVFAGAGTTELIRLSQRVAPSVQQEFGIGWCANNDHDWPGAQITALEYDASDPRRHLLFYTRESNADVAPIERLRITSNGLVGIGTTTPATKLHVTTASDNSTPLTLERTHNNNVIVHYKNPTLDMYAGLAGEGLGWGVGDSPDLGNANNIQLMVNSTGRIGIGTIAPETLLTIAKNATNQTVASIPTVRLTNLDTTAVATDIVGSYEFFSKDVHSLNKVTGFMRNIPTDAGVNYDLTFGTIKTGDSNAVERLRITSTGNVGINSEDPDSRLTVVGGGSSTGGILVKNVTYASNQNRPYLTVASMDFVGTATTQNWGKHGFQHRIKTDSGGSARITIDSLVAGESKEIISIKSNGKVGIGTNSPSHELDIESTSPVIEMKDNDASGDSRFQIAQSGAQTYFDVDVGNIGSSSLRFRFAGQERVRFTTGGSVGIGTNNPSALLHVENSIDGLGNNAGSSQNLLHLEGRVNNAGIASFRNIRLSNGNNWETAAFRIQRVVDVTNMGYIDFGTGGGGSGRDIQFGSGNGTTYMHLDNSGKVGIGTTGPDEKLNVKGFVAVGEDFAVNRPRIVLSAPNDSTNYHHLFGGNLKVDSSGDYTTPTANISGGGWLYRAANSLNAHGHMIYMSAPDTNNTDSTPLERLRIDASGRVLIGHDTTPAAAASVAIVGSYGATSNNTPFLYLCRDENISGITGANESLGQINFASKDGYRGAVIESRSQGAWDEAEPSSGGYLIFKTTGISTTVPVERVRITSDGNVGINTNQSNKPLTVFNYQLTSNSSSGLGTESNSKGNIARFTTRNPTSYLNLDIYDRRWEDGTSHAWSGTEKRIEYNVNGDSNKRMWISFFNPNSSTTNNAIRFGEQETNEWMVIKNGYVGIKTDDPVARLEVVDSRVTNTETGIARTYAITSQTELLVERNGNCIISAIGKTTANCVLNFGDSDDENAGSIDYDHANDSMSFRTAATSNQLRITGDGDVAIGRDSAQANYAAGTDTTKLAVVKDSAGSGYHEMAHFTAGSDANDTGAIVRITQFSNDRGLYIKAGRGTGDRAKAIFGLRSSSAAESDKMTINQDGKIEIAGNLQFTAANPEIELNNGGPRFSVPAANTLSIHTGGGLESTDDERVRITPTTVQLNTASNVHIRGGVFAKYTGASGNSANINTSSAGKISWLQTDTTIFGNGGFTNDATDVTVPFDGVYMVTFNGFVSGTGSGQRTNVRFRFRINGTDSDVDQSLNNYIRTFSSHNESSVNFTAYLNLTSGDTVAVSAIGETTVTTDVVLVKDKSSLFFHLIA